MRRVLFLPIVLMCSIGCGVCLYQPLHGDGASYFTPDLLGKWKGADDGRVWEFTGNEDGSYALGSNLSDATKTIYLTRLGDALFMTGTNTLSAEASDRSTCRYIISGRIVLQEDRFALQMVDVQNLTALLADSKDAPPHHIFRGQDMNLVIFTGEAQPVRAFLSRHAGDAEFFKRDSTMMFTRVTDQSSSARGGRGELVSSGIRAIAAVRSHRH